MANIIEIILPVVRNVCDISTTIATIVERRLCIRIVSIKAIDRMIFFVICYIREIVSNSLVQFKCFILAIYCVIANYFTSCIFSWCQFYIVINCFIIVSAPPVECNISRWYFFYTL